MTDEHGDIAASLDRLSARLRVAALQPGDAGFDAAIRIWNGMISSIPALVVQPASAEEVRQIVEFARREDLPLSVKGGGCHIAGIALADGGVVLDMARMRTVAVDRERRIADVGPGCLIREVDVATQTVGLATVLGSDSETGIAGLTLGGGFGYLTRRFGATVDDLEEVEIVTANGRILRAAANENEDLFWALRGGGGNFGVVTRFRFRLHEVGPKITGGLIVWDADRADEVLALYGDLAQGASRDLSLTLIMRLAPPAQFIPEFWRGKPVIAVLVCHIGEPSQAVKDLEPLRAVGRPIADTITRKSYVEQQAMLSRMELFPRGMHHYWKSEFLPGLSDAMLDAFRRHASLITAPRSLAMLYHLGGALADRDASATAFANRDAAYSFIAAGCWPPGDPDREVHRAWVLSTWDAVRPHSTGGNYINLQTADEDETRVAEAYGANLARLKLVKAAYDPDDLFRSTRTIPPAL